MNDELEGWEKSPYEKDRYTKHILGNIFYCQKHNGEWRLVFSIQYAATRPTLRECQRLAHATARLWAGETE